MTKAFLIFLTFGTMWLKPAFTERTALLSNEKGKVWALSSQTPEKINATCKATHPISLDNTFTFFTDGRFEFDHGSITEEPNCEGDCCSDLVNIVGKWEFVNDEKALRITALYEKEKPENAETLVLYYGNIEQLTEDLLIISKTDNETGVKYAFEFTMK